MKIPSDSGFNFSTDCVEYLKFQEKCVQPDLVLAKRFINMRLEKDPIVIKPKKGNRLKGSISFGDLDSIDDFIEARAKTTFPSTSKEFVKRNPGKKVRTFFISEYWNQMEILDSDNHEKLSLEDYSSFSWYIRHALENSFIALIKSTLFCQRIMKKSVVIDYRDGKPTKRNTAIYPSRSESGAFTNAFVLSLGMYLRELVAESDPKIAKAVQKAIDEHEKQKKEKHRKSSSKGGKRSKFGENPDRLEIKVLACFMNSISWINPTPEAYISYLNDLALKLPCKKTCNKRIKYALENKEFLQAKYPSP